MIHIGLVGFGAVAFVIKQGFTMITKEYDIHFTIYVRDTSKILSEYQDIITSNDKIIQIGSLEEVDNKQIQTLFGGIDYLINTSVPSNNLPMMKIAQNIGAIYIDLASVITTDMLGSQSFPQMSYQQAFVDNSLLALINAGVSPGITECIIADIVTSSGSTPRSIAIYLQEHLYTNGALPSRSPITGIEELTTNPARIEDGQIKTARPFDRRVKKSIYYQDENEVINIPISHYPLFQEELMSIYQQRPQSENICIWTGGGEVEEIKTLIEFGVLSEKESDGIGSKTFKELFISTLPSAATRNQIIQGYNQGSIDTIYFGALIEIEMTNGDTHKALIAFDKERWTSLQSTPCRGATYISYPTGIATVCMIDNLIKQGDHSSGVYNALEYALAHPKRTQGVLEEMKSLGILISY